MIAKVVHLVLIVVVVGFALWLLNKLIDVVPMLDLYKKGAKTFLMVVGILILLVLACDLGGIDLGLGHVL